MTGVYRTRQAHRHAAQPPGTPGDQGAYRRPTVREKHAAGTLCAITARRRRSREQYLHPSLRFLRHAHRIFGDRPARRPDASHEESRPGPFYVFLDEIQDVPGWEEVVRRLHSREDTDVYITGSNARLLSGELATHLTGRYITIPVYPLSFDEYQRHHRAPGTTDSTDQLFSKYMMFGGMPGLFVTGQPDQDKATEILTSIYESIVMKDVAGRYGIRDIATLGKTQPISVLNVGEPVLRQQGRQHARKRRRKRLLRHRRQPDQRARTLVHRL